MSFSEAASIYTLLTVGDGLVSQIPAIIISVAAGIVVTRASTKSGLSKDIKKQIFLKPKALYLSSGLLFFMSLIPGLPTISFLILSSLFFMLARYAETTEREEKVEQERLAIEEEEKQEGSNADTIHSLLKVDALALEVGVGLIPLVDTNQNGEVLERIISARKQFAQDLGIIVPMIIVRDNIQLKPREYQILLKGNVIGTGFVFPDLELAMAPDSNKIEIEGIEAKDPAYGLDAVWIKNSQKEEASFSGYTIVNSSTVIVTHLTKVIQDHASEILGDNLHKN